MKVEHSSMYAECISLHIFGYWEELTLLLRHVLRMQFTYSLWICLHMSPAYYIEAEISANSVIINQLHERFLLHLLYAAQQLLFSLWGRCSLCLINGTVKSHNNTFCPMNSSVSHRVTISLHRDIAYLLICCVVVNVLLIQKYVNELWLY
jgi:hypothetical protein